MLLCCSECHFFSHIAWKRVVACIKEVNETNVSRLVLHVNVYLSILFSYTTHIPNVCTPTTSSTLSTVSTGCHLTYGNCEQLCLPSETSTPTCSCRDNYIINGNQCVGKPRPLSSYLSVPSWSVCTTLLLPLSHTSKIPSQCFSPSSCLLLLSLL